MAQQVWRLPTENASFPLLSGLAGRTVAIPNQDVAYQKPQDIPRFRAKLVYCHNVLPISEGLKSVAFTQKVAAVSPAVTTFDEAWQVVDSAGNYGIFSPAAGANYFYPSAGPAWLSTPVVPATPVRSSKATVGGQSYICYGLTDVYTINCATGVLTSAGLTGVTPSTDIIGITSANNYLIAWNATTIFWSSPTNPVDFVPSLITGAGSGSPTELRGSILACYPALNGFYVYTTENIILATYSGNVQYPWVFKDIAGAMAIKDAENVTHAAVDIYNFAITAGGVVRFTSQGTEPVFPEVSEFLAAKQLEDYNGTALSLTTVTGGFSSRITRIGARYIVISYGQVANTFTHALVYDLALQRWGKLKITHTYCFAYPQQLVVDPLHQMAFMTSGGVISTVDLSNAAVGSGVAMIGGISVARGTMLTLHEVDVDAGSGTYTVSNFPSMDGKTMGTKVSVPVDATGLRHSRTTAQSHRISIEGSFVLSSAQVTTVQAGTR